MPRIARVVAVDVPHHITQRGNRGLDVFFTPDERQQYLVWLADYASRHGLKIWAYCLMTNHVHLVAVPTTPEALARVLRPVHARHAQRINAEHGWAGHLWHGRYFSCPLDNAHLWESVRYVERNSVRAGLTDAAETYPWSSAAPHCGLRPDPALSPDLPLLDAIDDWAEWLRDEGDETLTERLRRRTQTGIPCGSEAFVANIGSLAGRRLVARPRGRPKKQRKK